MDLTSNPMSIVVTENISISTQVEKVVTPTNSKLACGIVGTFRDIGWIGTISISGSKGNQFFTDPVTGANNWRDVRILKIPNTNYALCMDYIYYTLGQPGIMYGGIYDVTTNPWTLIKLVKSSNAA